MRRKDREVSDYRKILDILKQCDICRLGLVDSEGVYVVPLNFGYIESCGNVTLYFHGADEGRKIDIIKSCPYAGFEMDTGHRLVKKETACGYSYLYQSIIGNGTTAIVTDFEEKLTAMRSIMLHYSDKSDWSFDEGIFKRTAFIRLDVTSWSCKEHRS